MSTMTDLQPGVLLQGRYLLTSFLGQGGFARVWRARDQQLDREVAVKVLNIQHMALQGSMLDTVLKRFEREAKLAASIHHTNVVQIHDIGHVNGQHETPFIVMELLDGKDLKEYIDHQGPCQPTTFIPQFIACLDGLARAHELGIVHKDLKPSNLFISDIGRRTENVKLVDFGIAHINQPHIEGAGRLTSTGQLLGTPQYLPPEYIHSQQVSPAMDVYQMSLILVEALSAEYMLKDESSLQCLIIHGDGRLELPIYLMESPLGPILRRGLARDPALRYQDADAFATALSQVDLTKIPPRPLPRTQLLPRQRLDGSPVTHPEKPYGSYASQHVSVSERVPVDTPQAYAPTMASHQHAVVSAPASHPVSTRKKGVSGIVITLLIILGAVVMMGFCCIGALSESMDEQANQGAAEFFEVDDTKGLMDEQAEVFLPDVSIEENESEDLNVALQVKEAEQLLDQGKHEDATAICTRLIEEVNGQGSDVLSCYNVIMRAAWNPTRKFGKREKKACKQLKKYEEAYPSHRISIQVQRTIMNCVEHDY